LGRRKTLKSLKKKIQELRNQPIDQRESAFISVQKPKCQLARKKGTTKISPVPDAAAVQLPPHLSHLGL